MAYQRALYKIALTLLAGMSGVILCCNLWVTSVPSIAMYTAPHQVPATPYALVLGTSPMTIDGTHNSFFDNRMKASAQLYQHKKIHFLLLSGSHDRQYYNEPMAMKAYLLKLNVPAEAMFLDIKGDNTLTAIKRVKEHWNLKQITIVTQKFYAYRALYISRYFDLQATIFIADGTTYFCSRAWLREVLARVKVLIDLHILQKQCHSATGSSGNEPACSKAIIK